jgi:hypothetical protein
MSKRFVTVLFGTFAFTLLMLMGGTARTARLWTSLQFQHQHYVNKNNSMPPQFPLFDDHGAVDSLFESLPTNGCNSHEKSFLVRQFQNSSFVYLETELHRQRPQNFFRLPEFDHDSPDYYHVLGGVALFRNAFVQGERPPVVFDCSSIYVPGSCKSQEATNKKVFKLKKIGQSESLVIFDTVVMIYAFWGNAYYHAIVESLPRIAYLLEFLKCHPEVKILAGSTHLCQNSQILNHFLGINNTWAPYNPSYTYFAKRVLIPSGTPCGRGQPKCIEEIQKKLHVGEKSAQPTPRLSDKHLLVLQQRNSRKIINHEELLGALRSRFSSCCVVEVFHGTEPLSKNIELHGKAHVIIGPHGAGLSSAIFAQRGSGMVELHPQRGNFADGKVNLCHQETAKAAGLITRLVQQSDGSRFGDDFWVNVSEALDIVNDVLQAINHPELLDPGKVLD